MESILNSEKEIHRLIKINSVNFIEKAFQYYAQKKLFIIDNDNAENSKSLGIPLINDIPKPGGGWFQLKCSHNNEPTPAQVTFSSGTEGQAKAIVVSYRSLSNVVERLNKTMAIDNSIREYIGVPVTYSFGLGRCRAISVAGGKGYIPENGFNLVEIISMLKADEINAISSVPTLWRLVLSNKDALGKLGEKIKWIEIGSQYMSIDEKLAMRELFPNATIVQHYGLTEASRSTLLTISGAPKSDLASVGSITNNIEIKISADQRIMIKGEHVALGILKNGIITDLRDDDGWLLTNDIGRIDNGLLFYEGRSDDIINCGGIKVDPELVQQQVNKHFSNDEKIAIAPISDEVRGQAFFIVTTNKHADLNALKEIVQQELLTFGITARDAIKIQIINEIPTTETGKTKRKELSKLYKPMPTKAAHTAPLTEGKTPLDKIQASFKSRLNISECSTDDTFKALGGDSLTYVQTSLDIEKILKHMPANWENIPIKELASLSKTKGTKFLSGFETSALVRAYSVLGVVINHAGLTFLAGGAALLMLTCGLNLARFQWSALLNGKPYAFVRSLFLNILLPYWGLLLVFPILKGTAINISAMLLIVNISPSEQPLPFPAWFIAALLQCILITTIPLLWPRLREWVKHNDFKYGLMLMALAITLRLLDGYLNWGEAHHLEGKQTSWVYWLFALGFLLFTVKNTTHRWITSVLIITLPVVFYAGDYPRILTVMLGGLALIWLTEVRIPSFLKSSISTIASASLFIYLLHSRAPVNSMSADWPVDVIRIGSGVLLGLIGWKIYGLALHFASGYYSRMKNKLN